MLNTPRHYTQGPARTATRHRSQQAMPSPITPERHPAGPSMSGGKTSAPVNLSETHKTPVTVLRFRYIRAILKP